MDWVSETLIPPLLERALGLFDLARKQHGAEQLKSEWVFMDNRPALRLLARKALDGLESSDAGERERAFALMRRLVEVINPNDNHGFRARVVAGLLERGESGAAVAIANRYPNDMADMQYTRALALHVAGQENEASEVARFALKEFPCVGKFLLAESPRKPKKSGQYGYVVGSDEEAWLYREEFRPAWEKLNALAWLAGLTRGKT